MKSKVFKAIASTLLAAILMLSPTSTLYATQNNAVSNTVINQADTLVKTKNEVIYANLLPDGKVNALYAVNQFELEEPGRITDYGNYSSIENLTDTTPLTLTEGTIAIQTDTDNFYYQGDLITTDLPWKINITYYLDGVKKLPQEVAGSAGDLKIQVTTSKNNHIDSIFFDNYMLQLSMTLDTDQCKDIDSPGATIASAGKNKIITHTVMPGQEGKINVTSTVKDFTMSGIEISAVPFSMSMNLPETDDIVGDFNELTGAISDLNDGVGELATGTEELKTGAKDLEQGSADIKTGLMELKKTSGQLTDASSQINTALAQIGTSLLNGVGGNSVPGGSNLGDLSQLPQGLTQLAQGLEDISGGLTELKKGFTSAYTALDLSINKIPDASLTEEQIQALYIQTDPSQHPLLDQLVASYQSAQTVKGTYNYVKTAFDAVGPTCDTLSSSIDVISGKLKELSNGITGALTGSDAMMQMQQLTSGLSELSANYAEFHSGLEAYMNGISSIALGYPEFHSGVTALTDGIGGLHEGVTDMFDGTTQLNDEMKDLPDTMETEIDELMSQYTGMDFTPISFTSPKNTTTGFVQFVMRTEGIQKQLIAEVVSEEPVQETFWDRFLALFDFRK